MSDIDTLVQLLAQLTPEQRQEIVPKLIWAVEAYVEFETDMLTGEGSISRSFSFGFSRSSAHTTRTRQTDDADPEQGGFI
jgi:hypothetical protein